MTFRLVFILVFILGIQAHAQYSFTKLVWSDEFSKSGLPDSSRWSYDIGNGCPQICGWGNNELQYYTNSRLENARIKNGKLIIQARKEQFGEAKYTSARLVSKNKGDWKYGRIEVRAKLPAGTGIWPAIWMLPTKWEYGAWPKSGEIDIMEHVGYWPDSVLGTVHTGAYNGMIGTQKTNGIRLTDLSKAYHVYSIEWTTDIITFFIDNQPYFEFKNEHKGSETWPYDKEFHLLLNVAIGGNWGGKFGVDDSIFPQQLSVDFIRVYQ